MEMKATEIAVGSTMRSAGSDVPNKSTHIDGRWQRGEPAREGRAARRVRKRRQRQTERRACGGGEDEAGERRGHGRGEPRQAEYRAEAEGRYADGRCERRCVREDLELRLEEDEAEGAEEARHHGVAHQHAPLGEAERGEGQLERSGEADGERDIAGAVRLDEHAQRHDHDGRGARDDAGPRAEQWRRHSHDDGRPEPNEWAHSHDGGAPRWQTTRPVEPASQNMPAD
eukprot:scaffold124334_cov71-Phaeocystis_antarctica.AAC.2